MIVLNYTDKYVRTYTSDDKKTRGVEVGFHRFGDNYGFAESLCLGQNAIL